MAADNEIKVLLTADLAGLQAGMDAATESVTAASDAITAAVEESAAAVTQAQTRTTESIAAEAAAFNAAVQAKIDAQVRLNTAFAAGVGTAAGVAEAESALDEAMSAGAITAGEYAGYIERLDAAELEAAAAVDVATVAVTENTEAMVINGGVARELGVLTGEALRGNWTRLEGSAITLANRMDLLRHVFTGMGPAILGVTAAIAAFGVAAVKGAEEQARFNAALLMTGESAGVTTASVEQMARQIGESTGSYGRANEAMLTIIQSGRFTADQLQRVGLAAVEMSKLTGDSIEQSVQAFEKLQDKPVQAVVALNDKYHFLTASIFDQIEALQQQGNADEAARVGQDALAAALQKRTDEADANLGTLARAWDSVKESASFAWDAMLGVGREDTVDDKIAKLQAQLVAESSATLEHPKAMAKFNTTQGHVGWEVADGADPTESVAIKAQIEQLKALQATKALADGEAKKKGDDDAKVQQYTHDAEALNKWNEKLKDNANLQDQIAAKKAQVEKVHAEDPNSSALKGYTFDASGAVTGGEQWAATVAKLTKEYGEHLTPAVKQSAATAVDASRTAMNALDMERMGTQANTAERIQADAAVLASATRMYGSYSSQQKAALAQLLADEKSYDASIVKARKDALAQIASEEKKNTDLIKKAYDQAYADAAKSWHKYLDPINRAFQQSIQGMIQGTQTFRQMTARLLQSVAASYLQEGIKELENHIINQQAKTAATAAGAAERATIEAAAAVQSKATDAATGKSQIGTAAATGAAKAYQAIVGIPYVGPILAPIAAGVAFAGIEAFAGSIASARGGWDRVPIDGAMTELHKDEMVLPKPLADGVRNMAQNGGGQGGAIHVHTTDPRSFKDYMRRNPAAIASAVKLAGRRGHMLGAR